MKKRPIKIASLVKACDFLMKKMAGDPLSDMANRTFLSIIPSVQSDEEKQFTGGFDYKTLRVAAAGAPDLVKYGAKACVDELSNYGMGSRFSGLTPAEAKDRRGLFRKYYFETKQILDNGQIKDALRRCLGAFNDNDLMAWASKFGGKSWAKIAKTLLDISDLWDRLKLIRSQMNSSDRDEGRDYYSEEVSLMKEIVVMMNVFDGLSHNTGTVMPKVVDGFLQEADRALEGTYPDKERVKRHNKSKQRYGEEIEHLMDAKQLSNPFDVYRAIDNIVEKSPQKHIFKDWISKIRRNPQYEQSMSENDRLKQLFRIRLNKVIKAGYQGIEESVMKLANAKDKLINSKEKLEKDKLFTIILDEMFLLDREANNLFQDIWMRADENKNLVEGTKISEFVGLLSALARKIRMLNLKYESETKYFYNEIELINDINNLNKDVNIVKYRIDELI